MRATLTLFGDIIRSRPKRYDDSVIDRAVDLAFDALQKESDGHWNDSAKDELRDMFHSCGDDGYERGQYLDRRYGWMIDATLVDLLNHSFLEDAREEAVKHWVATEGIEPDRAIGDKVLLPHDEIQPRCLVQLSPTEPIVGEIVDIYADRAEYVVSVPVLGHVRRDQARKTGGVTGFVYPFEAIDALPKTD